MSGADQPTAGVALKPCPFCSSGELVALEVDHLTEADGKEMVTAAVVCRKCGARGRRVEDERPVAVAKALHNWNTRTPASGAVEAATGGEAVVRDGQLLISIDVDALPIILSGSVALGAVGGLWKVTDAAAFAKEVCGSLNAESENGTTRVHTMFDSAFSHAIEYGAEGVEEVDEDAFEVEAARLQAEALAALTSSPKAEVDMPKGPPQFAMVWLNRGAYPASLVDALNGYMTGGSSRCLEALETLGVKVMHRVEEPPHQPLQGGEDSAAAWRETFIAEEADGPACGILIDLPDGSQIWTGEASDKLLVEAAADDLSPEDSGHFLVFAAKGREPRVIAQLSGIEDGMTLARALATSLQTEVQP